MNRLCLPLLFWVFLPFAISDADMVAFDEESLPITGSQKHSYAGFLSSVSPDYSVNRNILALTPVPYNRDSRAINFVFFMNKKKTEIVRPRMHIMWTGSKKII